MAAMGMRIPLPNAPPVHRIDQPAVDAMGGDEVAAANCRISKGRGMKGAPKQWRRLPAASFTPFPCPRPWPFSRKEVIHGLGGGEFCNRGSTPKASAVSMIMFFGWPAWPLAEALAMKSSDRRSANSRVGSHRRNQACGSPSEHVLQHRAEAAGRGREFSGSASADRRIVLA